MASKRPLDDAIEHLENVVREDFAERRSTRHPRKWWGSAALWQDYLVGERAALRSYIAAVRVLRRELAPTRLSAALRLAEEMERCRSVVEAAREWRAAVDRADVPELRGEPYYTALEAANEAEAALVAAVAALDADPQSGEDSRERERVQPGERS